MSEADFKTKYLKYKKKYLDLKSQIEGGADGSVFSKDKVLYIGLIQKNSPFKEFRDYFRNGFYKNTEEIELAHLKRIANTNAYRWAELQNRWDTRITEQTLKQETKRGLSPYAVLKILLDPLPRLAVDEITLDYLNNDNSPFMIRNLETEQELFDAVNTKDWAGRSYTLGGDLKVEHIKVLVAATNPSGYGFPRFFEGPYAMKGIKHPCVRVSDEDELRLWEKYGLTYAEKKRNEDLLYAYRENTGKNPEKVS